MINTTDKQRVFALLKDANPKLNNVRHWVRKAKGSGAQTKLPVQSRGGIVDVDYMRLSVTKLFPDTYPRSVELYGIAGRTYRLSDYNLQISQALGLEIGDLAATNSFSDFNDDTFVFPAKGTDVQVLLQVAPTSLVHVPGERIAITIKSLGENLRDALAIVVAEPIVSGDLAGTFSLDPLQVNERYAGYAIDYTDLLVKYERGIFKVRYGTGNSVNARYFHWADDILDEINARFDDNGINMVANNTGHLRMLINNTDSYAAARTLTSTSDQQLVGNDMFDFYLPIAVSAKNGKKIQTSFFHLGFKDVVGLL